MNLQNDNVDMDWIDCRINARWVKKPRMINGMDSFIDIEYVILL